MAGEDSPAHMTGVMRRACNLYNNNNNNIKILNSCCRDGWIDARYATDTAKKIRCAHVEKRHT